MKVGFLFIHEAGHQVAHSLPTALALARLRPDVAVHILYADGAGAGAIAAAAAGQRVTATRLSVRSKLARGLERVLGNAVPVGRVAVLRDNVELFRGFDALVVPEKTSLILKSRFGLPHLKMIHTRHGAGDRAIGFDKASGEFDFMLLPGAKVRDRLDAIGVLRPGNHAIVGYPKFDLLRDRPRPRPFANDRPTVLYNPHPSPHLSSWYRMGRDILAWFADSPDYNLIFAPHVMLFRKRVTVSIDRLSIARTGRVPDDIRRAPNILVDTGSAASVDMTYTQGADVYLGDASSQIYEFLADPRPALFADAHGVDWHDDPDFAHWHAGPVFTDTNSLGATLDRAIADHADQAPVQRAMFDATFSLTDTPSSERAAAAIGAYLDGTRA